MARTDARGYRETVGWRERERRERDDGIAARGEERGAGEKVGQVAERLFGSSGWLSASLISRRIEVFVFKIETGSERRASRTRLSGWHRRRYRSRYAITARSTRSGNLDSGRWQSHFLLRYKRNRNLVLSRGRASIINGRLDIGVVRIKAGRNDRNPQLIANRWINHRAEDDVGVFVGGFLDRKSVV